MRKNTAIRIIVILAIVIVTILTGPWLLDIIGNVLLFLGKVFIKIGEFLNFFGIGG